MTITPATSLVPLSARLRAATRPQHEHAETRSFVTDLVDGRLTRDAYVDLAIQHYAIYSALEAAGARMAGDPVGGAFVLPELLRLPSLEADLLRLKGANWSESAEILPATRTYVDRLAGEGTAWAGGFLAHAYTRYLGDLSGGQIISRMVQRHYGLREEELTFYVFADIPKPKLFKDDFRALMDAADFTEAEKARVIDEARLAFDLNAALFVELGARHPGESDVSSIR